MHNCTDGWLTLKISWLYTGALPDYFLQPKILSLHLNKTNHIFTIHKPFFNIRRRVISTKPV